MSSIEAPTLKRRRDERLELREEASETTGESSAGSDSELEREFDCEIDEFEDFEPNKRRRLLLRQEERELRRELRGLRTTVERVERQVAAAGGKLRELRALVEQLVAAELQADARPRE